MCPEILITNIYSSFNEQKHDNMLVLSELVSIASLLLTYVVHLNVGQWPYFSSQRSVTKAAHLKDSDLNLVK